MYVKIGKIYNHINRSFEELSKKTLMDKIAKRLSELEFKSSHLMKSKRMLSKNYCHHYKTKQTYCLSWKKHTDSIGSKKVVMTNKVTRQASKCANCVPEKSRFFAWNKIDP